MFCTFDLGFDLVGIFRIIASPLTIQIVQAMFQADVDMIYKLLQKLIPNSVAANKINRILSVL